jgi:hypothetical protein
MLQTKLSSCLSEEEVISQMVEILFRSFPI